MTLIKDRKAPFCRQVTPVLCNHRGWRARLHTDERILIRFRLLVAKSRPAAKSAHLRIVVYGLCICVIEACSNSAPQAPPQLQTPGLSIRIATGRGVNKSYRACRAGILSARRIGIWQKLLESVSALDAHVACDYNHCSGQVALHA